jgi:hypothetical protein
MGAVCAKAIGTGNGCGVAAVGRCLNCGDAFCQSHQARKQLPTGIQMIIDQCQQCLVAAAESVARVQQEAALDTARVSARRAQRVMRLKSVLRTAPEHRFIERREIVGSRRRLLGNVVGPYSKTIYGTLPRALPIGDLPFESPPGNFGVEGGLRPMPAGITVAGAIVMMNCGPPGEERVFDWPYRGTDEQLEPCLEGAARRLALIVD